MKSSYPLGYHYVTYLNVCYNDEKLPYPALDVFVTPSYTKSVTDSSKRNVIELLLGASKFVRESDNDVTFSPTYAQLE